VGWGYKTLFVIMPPLWAFLITLFRLSWRVRHVDPERSREAKRRMREGHSVFACWHQRLFHFLRHIRKTKGTIMVSLSPDGELMTRTLHLLGHYTVRGSSSRRAGGALKEMIAAVKERGQCAMIMADGPKGPPFTAKPGVLAIAKEAEVGYVIPSAAAASPVVKLGSWDRFQIPWPFAKVVYAYGDPIPVPLDATREQLEACRQQLEAALNEQRDLADTLLHGAPRVVDGVDADGKRPKPPPAGGDAPAKG
ncbi:MAG: lysophospholipid acyltransferase family protein, partial [Planctomycetota bacterium]